mmetsp:Transcript_20118/g.24038  ORF Transcript_20118/g.24038 Transcript_20118/m.24038 type:complete len:92 (-) Transcript_20118:249-524(-)|eukprot:CAMPEP_0198253784 /NCGR_PEP_ID=MMETSP1447-20131203/4175_1 /TAXON_ID=420782 /ORGANISM="Chaetoceros dichaeta, Strain CCMP1751" /LENGTH=91 /DNA_ID=CAMNT_0043939599 /DNA_START=382 /DNA_END=657 /DNA_ORIENTATION=-
MGVISTPNAGGIDPRISFNNGSVGQTAILKGSSLSFADGYHEMTTRQSMANEKMLKNGPKTDANGLTQGSVSESKMEDDEEVIRAEETCST